MPKIIKIAADSIEALRSADVYRVLDEAGTKARNSVAEYIISHRDDLAGEVSECLEEFAA